VAYQGEALGAAGPGGTFRGGGTLLIKKIFRKERKSSRFSLLFFNKISKDLKFQLFSIIVFRSPRLVCYPIGAGTGKFLGVRKIFAQITPKLPEKFLGYISCDFHMSLGAIFSNQSTLGAIFARIFMEFS